MGVFIQLDSVQVLQNLEGSEKLKQRLQLRSGFVAMLLLLGISQLSTGDSVSSSRKHLR